MFLLPSMLTSGIIIFFLVLKQPLFGTLVLLNSREDPPDTPRSFVGLRFNQRSYPLFSWDIRLRPRRGYATSPARTTFAPQHLCSLEGLKCSPCGLFSRMYLRTVDSARDISNDQWATSVPFDCLFNVSFDFL